MGLSNSVYVTTKNTVNEDWCYEDDDLTLEIFHCWKHTLLHDWMHRLYHEKGGSNYDTYFGAVALTQSDLDRLEVDIEARSLSKDAKANSEYSDKLSFFDSILIDKARRAIAMGLTVFYSGH